MLYQRTYKVKARRKKKESYIHFEALQFLESVPKQVTNSMKGQATDTTLDES